MFTELDEIDKTLIQTDYFIEYVSFKEQNPDSIILIQIGAFFETFLDDAKTVSEITGINLTSRFIKGLGKALEAGIPTNSMEFYLKMLLNKNLKVCLCPQFYDENKKIFRKIVRKFTKGTIVENDLLEQSENNYILALYKDERNYNLAYADVSTGQFYRTSSARYNEILVEVDKIEPSEILISDSQRNIFSDFNLKYHITFLADKDFENDVKTVIISYCKKMQKDYLVALDEIVDYKINDFMIIDEITRFNLELSRTKLRLKKKGSLFWFLNYTSTPMGARLLKKYINEPLLIEKLILQRQEAVKELIENNVELDKLYELMAQLCDLSRISARISNLTIQPKDLFTIVENLNNVKILNELSLKFSSPLLKINQNNFRKVLELCLEIENSILPNAQNDAKNGNIIKEGYDSNLDLLVDKLNKVKNDILNYEKSERTRLKIDKLKIGYIRNIGTFIEIPISKKALAPPYYYQKNSTSTCVRYTTDKLKEFEEKKDELEFKVKELEYELFCKVRRKAVVFVDIVRHIADDIAKIDVLISFAKCAIENHLSCPKFNSEKFYIKNGFHPSLLKLNNEIIKNDTLLKIGEMYVLTGSNMSGKSTYLRHNAIIALLAQIGSFVPADLADNQIIDKIFLRQGSSDDIINNNSSFMVEMNDLKYIIDNASPFSLVLLDEPAKSTSSLEGGAIARAYLEYFIQNIKSKCIVVTHNLELTKIQKVFPKQVFNFQIGFNSNSYDRKLRPGVATSSNALNTAKLANLPDEIIKKAQEFILKG